MVELKGVCCGSLGKILALDFGVFLVVSFVYVVDV